MILAMQSPEVEVAIIGPSESGKSYLRHYLIHGDSKEYNYLQEKKASAKSFNVSPSGPLCLSLTLILRHLLMY